MSLKCTDPNISYDDWQSCLRKIDDDIKGLHSDSDKLVIISCPYYPRHIKQCLEQYILKTFTIDSILFCYDIIMEYIVLNKYVIQHKINNHHDTNNRYKKWSIDKHDGLLSTQSLIIIDLITANYVSIPTAFNLNIHL